MRKFAPYLALALILAFGSELGKASILITVSSKKKASDETRQVSGFSGISSSGSFNVYITMGNTESLRLEGDPEVLKEIETNVEDGVLKIRNKKGSKNFNWGNNSKVNIYINAKSLSSLALSGSGNIKVEGVVKANQLSNALSGSGGISLNMDVKSYTGTISGSGEIKVKGKADNAKISVNGSGDFEGDGLRTSVANVKISGSGDVSVNADKTLNVGMSGSGNVRYGGKAEVNSTASGSGHISKL